METQWLAAWRWITSNWGGEWQPIPAWVRQTLGLDARVGVGGGQIVTRHSYQMAQEFVRRLNESAQRYSQHP